MILSSRSLLVTPVIHVRDPSQVVSQADMAVAAGADGVFLCDHGALFSVVVLSLEALKATHPTLWVGLNLLSGPKYTGPNVDAIWTDYVPTSAERSRHAHLPHFAGVMFKHQPQSPQLVYRAQDLGAIPVTSGPATGAPPTVGHVQRVRALLTPGVPLGIASGLAPDNIESYLELANVFMVATGVSKDFHTFDPGALSAFVDVVHSRRTTA